MKLAVVITALFAVQLCSAAPRHHHHQAPPPPPPGPIDLSECGKTKGCVVSPAKCQGNTCDYIYTHQVDAQNPAMVNIELSANAAGWVAVGFNNMKAMNGTDVLACQLTPDMQKVVAKNLHNVNHTNVLDQAGQASPFITNAEGHFADGRITCRFTRPMKTSDTEHDMDLSQRHFLIFAFSLNGTAAENVALSHPHSHHPKVTTGVYSASDNMFINSSVIPIDLSTCGKAKGCSRLPPGCATPEECFYVYSQQPLPGNMVAFEIAAMVHGWAAVGFNNVQKMNGTDVMACQIGTKHSGVFVKNLHNVNHTNVMDDPDLVDPNIEDPQGWIVEQHIVCKFSRAIVTPNPEFDANLAQPHYIIFAGSSNGTAPSNTALDHKHDYEPIITPQMHTGVELFNINGTAPQQNAEAEHHEKRAHAHWRH